MTMIGFSVPVVPMIVAAAPMLAVVVGPTPVAVPNLAVVVAVQLVVPSPAAVPGHHPA